MKKQIMRLGKVLSKEEQKSIFGGIVKSPIVPEVGMGICIDGSIIPCDSKCPNGFDPICQMW